jgi:dihydroorotase
MSVRPARIAAMAHQGRPVEAGEVANLCVFDPEVTWEVSAEDTMSRSRNNPWAGRTLTGRVRHTIVAGCPVVEDGSCVRD